MFFLDKSNKTVLLLNSLLLIGLIAITLASSRRPLTLPKHLLLPFLVGIPLVVLFFLGMLINSVLLYYLVIVSLVVYFQNNAHRIAQADLIQYLNSTYLLFIFLSLAFYLGLIPNQFRDNTESDPFVYFGDIWAFYGLGGTTATIDTYSAFMFLFSLLISKNKWIMSLAAVCLLATLRFTPIVALLSVLVIYPLLKYPTIGRAMIAFIPFSFLTALLVSGNESAKVIADLATHGRVTIWTMHLEIFWNNLDVRHLFTMYDVNYFIEPGWYVAEGKYVTENSHNSYLIWLRRSPLFFLILYVTLLVLITRKYNQKHVAIAVVVLIGAITNSEIFYVYNLNFLIFFAYAYFVREGERRGRAVQYE